MRLSKEQIDGIKKAFFEVFKEGEIYLFGSRTDDTKKGGDIDLYLCPHENREKTIEKKIDFLVKLDSYIGEQKVDVIIAKDSASLIEREALKHGVLL